jgi:hypothetical protein
MGNGGCGCNVRNYEVIADPTKKSNYKKLLDMNLNNVDLKLCEDYQIGPFMTKSFTEKIHLSSYNSRSLSLLNEFLRDVNYLEKSRKITKIDMMLDYRKLIYKSNLMKIYNKILLMPSDKLKETLFYCWNNTMRILFYVILMLVEERNTNETNNYHTTEEKLLLKDNSVNTDNYNLEKAECILIEQVDKDINRTFCFHKISSVDIYLQNLKDILLTIGREERELGYVQGMNYIASFLLIFTGNQKKISLDLF